MSQIHVMDVKIVTKQNEKKHAREDEQYFTLQQRLTQLTFESNKTPRGGVYYVVDMKVKSPEI